MSQTILEQNIIGTLGLETLSDQEKVAFLSQVGDVLIESVLLRLVADMTPEQEVSLGYYLETSPDSETLLTHLLEHYKDFELILQEEIIAFKEEAITSLAQLSK